MKIAIVGAGNMGGAIARGLAQSGFCAGENSIVVSNPGQAKLEALRAEYAFVGTTGDNRAAASGADIVILAVKPWMIKEVLEELKMTSSQLLVSLAAGIDCGDLVRFAGTELPVFRAIPNTAVSLRQSMTLLASRNASEEQISGMKDLFGRLGRCLYIPEEKMAAATALCSCGIAFVFKYMQAAMQAGIEMGVPRDESLMLVAQSVKGAAELILDGPAHPSAEIDKVTTPGGITIKGVNELDHAGFSSAVIRAMKACR